MSATKTEFAQMATPVLDFFCPELKENPLSFATPLIGHIDKLCQAAGILTLKDLVTHSDKDLRAKSFGDEVVTFIHDALDAVGLRLSPDYPSAVPAHLEYLKQLNAQ